MNIDQALAFIFRPGIKDADFTQVASLACDLLGTSAQGINLNRNGFNNDLVVLLDDLVEFELMPTLGEVFTLTGHRALSDYDRFRFVNSHGETLTADDGCIVKDLGDSNIMLMLKGDPQSIYVLYHDLFSAVEMCNLTEYFYMACVSALLENNAALYQAVVEILESDEHDLDRHEKDLVEFVVYDLHEGYAWTE